MYFPGSYVTRWLVPHRLPLFWDDVVLHGGRPLDEEMGEKPHAAK